MLYKSLADVNSRFYTPVSPFSNESIPYYHAYVAFQDPRNALNTITGFSVFKKNTGIMFEI
jgi:hypothetical protein